MRKHLYYYTHLDAPSGTAIALLSGSPAGWLPAPACPAEDEWEVTLHARGALAAPSDALPARVAVSPPEQLRAGLMLPVRWRPAAAGSPLQVLEADLELSPLEGYGCHLAMVGTYRPPLSVTVQPSSTPRVMEACLRSFVLAVAQRIGTATLPA
jgi:hypothetical protein